MQSSDDAYDPGEPEGEPTGNASRGAVTTPTATFHSKFMLFAASNPGLGMALRYDAARMEKPDNREDRDQCLTVRGAAAFLDVSITTIYSLMHDEIAWHQVAGRRRILRSDLDAYLRRHRVEGE